MIHPVNKFLLLQLNDIFNSTIKNIIQNNYYTLLFLGGRQPLCGNGVTSLIIFTSIPD